MTAYECMLIVLILLGILATLLAFISFFWDSWKLVRFGSMVFLAIALIGALAFASRPYLGRWYLPIFHVLIAWWWWKMSEWKYKREKEKDVDGS